MTFEQEWARCAPWIESALAHAGGTHRPGDVKAMIQRGEADFWPGRRSAAVTLVEDEPCERRLLIWLAGGDLAELGGPMLKRMETRGREAGCRRALIVGRPGWERALKPQGYAPLARLIAKDL